MPTLPFVAELYLRRKCDNLVEIELLYTGHPEHSKKVIQELERICMRLLKTQIPAIYKVMEEVATCSDPAMVDMVLRRERLTDNHVVWLKNHLKRGFQKRALNVLFKDKDVYTIDEEFSTRWVMMPESGFRNTAQRAVRDKKTHQRSRTCRKRSNLGM